MWYRRQFEIAALWTCLAGTGLRPLLRRLWSLAALSIPLCAVVMAVLDLVKKQVTPVTGKAPTETFRVYEPQTGSDIYLIRGRGWCASFDGKKGKFLAAKVCPKVDVFSQVTGRKGALWIRKNAGWAVLNPRTLAPLPGKFNIFGSAVGGPDALAKWKAEWKVPAGLAP